MHDRPNDPASDPEVVRVARVLAAGLDREHDPDNIIADGEPRWRAHVNNAIGAIRAHKIMTSD